MYYVNERRFDTIPEARAYAVTILDEYKQRFGKRAVRDEKLHVSILRGRKVCGNLYWVAWGNSAQHGSEYLWKPNSGYGMGGYIYKNGKLKR